MASLSLAAVAGDTGSRAGVALLLAGSATVLASAARSRAGCVLGLAVSVAGAWWLTCAEVLGSLAWLGVATSVSTCPATGTGLHEDRRRAGTPT